MQADDRLSSGRCWSNSTFNTKGRCRRLLGGAGGEEEELGGFPAFAHLSNKRLSPSLSLPLSLSLSRGLDRYETTAFVKSPRTRYSTVKITTATSCRHCGIRRHDPPHFSFGCQFTGRGRARHRRGIPCKYHIYIYVVYWNSYAHILALYYKLVTRSGSDVSFVGETRRGTSGTSVTEVTSHNTSFVGKTHCHAHPTTRSTH